MTDRSTEHAMFDIERIYDAAPAKVFQAWADPVAKARWFGPTDGENELSLDFQIGGREHFTGAGPNDTVFRYDACFHEIVPGHRIVYTYTVDFDQTRISVSLVTVEITPSDEERTRLLYTEQTVYLDDGDTPADRERGTRAELDNLGVALQSVQH